MRKPAILISAVGGDIGSSAVRSLRKKVRKIVGCDMNPYSPVLEFIDEFYKAPPASDIETYMDFIKSVIDKEDVGFFLPISDAEITVLNSRREELNHLGIKQLINNEIIVNNFIDKLKTADYLTRLGLRAPKTVLLKDYDGSFGFPLVVKPRSGHGSKQFYKVEDQADLDYARLKDDGFLIAQECIGSDLEEYTTGVFSDGSSVSSITFWRKLGFGGLSVEAHLVDEPFLDDLAERIAKDTGLIGSINIQSRRLGDIFIPFEVNPRLSSTLLFRKKFGFDDAVWWLDVLCGKEHSFKRKFKSGRAIRCLSECYFDMEKLTDEN
jgi:carbamoyl-phosphate synthase large subunit